MQLLRATLVTVIGLSFGCSGGTIVDGPKAGAVRGGSHSGGPSSPSEGSGGFVSGNDSGSGSGSRAGAGGGTMSSGGSASGPSGGGSNSAGRAGSGNSGGRAASGGTSSGGATASAGAGQNPGPVDEPPPPDISVPRPALPCFANPGAPAGEDEMTLAVSASRVRGVAPLVVFFDTDGSTSEGVERPFHELAYCWDFDDPDAGSYATTGLSKNQAKGPLAAHTFERPGTYTVTVTARDPSGRVTSRGVDITVEDPAQVYAGDATTCVSPSGDFEGCPAGAQQVRASAIEELDQHFTTGRRVLLHRGERFTSAAQVQINAPGPGTVGAYGEGAPPRIRAEASVFMLSGNNGRLADWRFMDFEIEGLSDRAGGFGISANAKDVLILRTRMWNIGHGVSSDISGINLMRRTCCPDADLVDRLAIQDSEIRDLIGGGGHVLVFVSAHRLMLLGNIIENSLQGEHVLRTPWIDRGIIANNRLGDAPEGRTVVKLHGPVFEQSGSIGEGKFTERLVISDNIVRSTGGHSWTFAMCPQNAQEDERIRDVVIERNWFQPGEAAGQLQICAQDVTVRDNIFNAGDGMCMETSRRGIEPTPTRIALIHNTCRTSRNASPLIIVDPSVNPSTNQITAFNNLVVSSVRPEQAAGGVSRGSNNVVGQMSTLTGQTLEAFLEFTPLGTSPAIDTAAPDATSPWDFAGHPRPVDGDGSGTAEPDVGALERTE